jgi:protein-L-isoaspartate(D-aspartate) O-methyltransferase
MSLYAEHRHYMVESQLRTNKVTNASVLAAFKEVSKENFVDAGLAPLVYVDEDLNLGGGRFMLEPMVFARLVQALDLKPSDNVLDIGAAGGYSTAILARLAQSVVGIERSHDLAEKAQVNLLENDVDNAVVLKAPHPGGMDEEAPYNAIIIEGSVQVVPEKLLRQLTEDGRLVTVLRDNANAPGRGVKYVRGKGGFTYSVLFDAQTPMLEEFTAAKAFAF